MRLKAEPDETILHRARGLELVTTMRLVLGRESWLIEDIQDASLTGRPSYYMVQWTKEHTPGMAVAGGLLVVCLSWPIWGQYVPGSPCFLVVAFLSAIAAVMYTLARHPGEIYNIKLQLQNGDSQESRYTVQDKNSAEKLISAIKSALVGHAAIE